MTLYSESGAEVTLKFHKQGIDYDGRTYAFMGRKTYRADVEPERCEANRVGRQSFELKFVRDGVEHKRTDYLGCAAVSSRRRLPVARTVTRQFALARPDSPTCDPAPFKVSNGRQTVTFVPGCDGTLTLRWADGLQEVLSRRGRRFQSKGRIADRRWSLTVTPNRPRRGERTWTVSGRVRGPQALRLRGRFRRGSDASAP